MHLPQQLIERNESNAGRVGEEARAIKEVAQREAGSLPAGTPRSCYRLINICITLATPITPIAPMAFNHKKLISGRKLSGGIFSLKKSNTIKISTTSAEINVAVPFTCFM